MYAGTVNELNFFNQLHPFTVAVYFVGLFSLLLMFNHLLLGIGMFGVILGVCSWYFDTHKIRQLLIGSLSLMGMIVLFNLLLNQTGTVVLWQVKWGVIDFRLTQTAVIYGLTMALLLGSMIITFILFNGIITTPKLSYLLFPIVPRLAMLMIISLRFVDLFIQKMQRLAMFQKTRGVVLTEGNFKQRLLKMGQLMRIILVDTISEAMETATLMEARGFGVTKRSQYQRFHFRVMDWLFLTISAAIFGVIVTFRVKGYGWTNDVTQLTWVASQDWLLFGLIAGFCLLPLCGEGGYRLWEN